LCKRLHTRCNCDWSPDVCSSDLVPIVLDGAIPKSPGQGFVGRRGRAVFNTQGFYFIECIGVFVAGQLRGRTWAELVCAVQGKRRDMRPMRELRLWRKVRRRRLVITRGGPENVRNRLSVGAVDATQS